jgi:ATP-dependent 26S proteasome regulatory subunit
MAVGSLEEIIDDNHAIVSTSVGSEYYVSILSFVEKDDLEPGCTILLNHKVWCAFVCVVSVYLVLGFRCMLLLGC